MLTLKSNADETAEKKKNVFYKRVVDSHFRPRRLQFVKKKSKSMYPSSGVTIQYMQKGRDVTYSSRREGMLPILEEGKGCYLFLQKGRDVTYSCRREGMLPIHAEGKGCYIFLKKGRDVTYS